MTVPVRTLKRLRPQACWRQRNGMVLCWHPIWTLRDPQYGQCTPDGQRCLMNHSSAFALLGKRRKRAFKLTPLRCDLPGAFALLVMTSF